MSWQLINGIFIGRGRGSSLGPNSALQAKFLFWGKYSEISGGHMPNKLTGTTDYLTIAGSPETYQAPNTASYIAADTDHIWFETDETQRTTTTAELVGYDFPRTLVKYDNTSPYAIREIIILKFGETLTTTEENYLRDYMQLSIWWSNVSSDYGVTKGNRTGEQSVWVPMDTASLVLFTAMTTKPDNAHKIYYDTLIKAWKAAGFWDRTEVMLILAGTSVADAMIWVNDPTKTATAGDGTFTQYQGYLGNTTTAGRITVGWQGQDRLYLTQDSASIIMYSRTNNQDLNPPCLMGATDKSITISYLRNASNDTRFYLFDNSWSTLKCGTDSTGCVAWVRDSSSTKKFYRNKSHVDQGGAASTGIDESAAMYIIRDAREYSFFVLTDGFSTAEMSTATDIIEAFMDSLGIGVI